MTSEVTKYSVFDPRIVQTKPKYAVEKGALSLTNVSFQAQTADSSSVQFNIQVPSENVFVDRAVQWNCTQVAQVFLNVVVPAAVTVPAGTPLSGLVATAAFPLHQSVTQMSATINDATVTVNTQDVLPQILRLADMRDARRQRTCPTMLDRYAQYPDSRVVKNSPLQLWDETTESDSVPNGGFNGLYFATPTGQPILETGDANSGANVASATSGGGSYSPWQLINGLPCVGTAGLAAGATYSFAFYVAWASVENLLLPPFIFADEDELSTGLFGVQNFQVQMNMAPSPSRSVRLTQSTTIPTSSGSVWASTTVTTAPVWLNGLAGGGMFYSKPTLAVQFLTPSLDIPLPPKSIVPYAEYPRYIATPNTSVASSSSLFSASTQLVSQTITLPNIPDLLVIYVKPSSYSSSTQGDWSLPITQISINFDNFSGLLANHTQEELYQMSVRNGVDMDFSEWSGYGVVSPSHSGASPTSVTSLGGRVGLVGGPLVLRPGRDFALQAGQACGLVGNFTLQFTLSVQNFTGSTQTPNIFTVPISSGFFETIKGSSRIIKGVLTEQDILSAPAHAPAADLERPVGSGRSPMGGRNPSDKRSGVKSYMM
jgi:hypothetical protein